MTEKQKIQEGLIDKVFGALEKGIKKARRKATAKAMRDPKVQAKFRDIKKRSDDLHDELEKLLGI
mgnify:FL=1|jgi:ribosome-binding ATPase YchF (GTP1/OBG family)|tara:strand:- start:116 stop:310 length:195 start_codon:yes stop_codon:yes gene_type:complete